MDTVLSNKMHIRMIYVCFFFKISVAAFHAEIRRNKKYFIHKGKTSTERN